MYVIREMLPADRPAAEQLWARRLAWARARGVAPIRTAPLAAAPSEAVPLVLTVDGALVALATVVIPADHDDGDRPHDRGRALLLERLVTDPAVVMPEGGPLSWIITARISDAAARAGYDWVRMRVGPARLAAHLRTRLAWQHEATVSRDGAVVQVLCRRAERRDAIRALVRTSAAARADAAPGLP
ncbi:hypothetical protein [Streptomyces griseus]|uniref:hypothetical protein n=2 Tax=Streptomyces griseus TaxID=1911 RepID=UPI0004CB93B6|nr:hypothetical protein [Streptomyces griseus]